MQGLELSGVQQLDICADDIQGLGLTRSSNV
jgi:hypothetical protein